MHNPTVSLLAVAAAAGTVFASETPYERRFWHKIDGTWKYEPPAPTSSAPAPSAPTPSAPTKPAPVQPAPVLREVLNVTVDEKPHPHHASVNVTVAPRHEKVDKEDDNEGVVDDDDDDRGVDREDGEEGDAEYEAEVKKLEARKRKGVVCTVL